MSFYFFVLSKSGKNKTKPRIYGVFDFMFIHWPRYFMSRPSGYKITKYFGDFLHHIFLKK